MKRIRLLPAVTWIYVAWSLLPVLLAIRFAFNEGRSRTSAQGWSLRWFWTDPTLSVRNDPTLAAALEHSLVLAGLAMLIALPMFGDYYTPDLISGSPRTAMLGNTINNYVQGGPDKALGAAMTLLLSAFLLIFMVYYLRELRRETP